MANWEHLAILRQGVKAWNEWREANPEVVPDLTGADISGVTLRDANLRDALIEHGSLLLTALIGFPGNHFYNPNLNASNFRRANLSYANLEGANLRGANFGGVYLTNANLRNADLIGATLIGATLIGANLMGANLRNANLSIVQALFTNFKGATLTGACIQDWHINARTNFRDVICEYVYLKWSKDRKNWSERRPSNLNRNFASGEFTKLFQKAQETVDLIFRNGVDWQALLISLDKLRVEADGAEFPIQAIENKDDGDFVVRLKTPLEANKAEVERFVRQEYEAQLRLLESQYRTQLQGIQFDYQGEIIALQRQHNTEILELAKLAAGRPSIIHNTNNNTVEATAVSNSQSSGDTYNGPIKATNFAPHGVAMGGTFNDYSQTITNNLDEIQQLITTLRSQAEQFPPDVCNEVLEHLNDLQDDLQHPDKVKPSRLKATFAALLAISVGLGGAIATATDFSNNVLELGKKFGVELVHPQGGQSSPVPQSPHSQGAQTVDVANFQQLRQVILT